MLFRAKKPPFDEIDGEYVIPIRLSEETAHSMIGGWFSMGIGHGHLRARKDGSFDLFVKPPTPDELNAVPLDRVSEVLMAALDLAHFISEDETSSDEVIEAATRIREMVSIASQ